MAKTGDGRNFLTARELVCRLLPSLPLPGYIPTRNTVLCPERQEIGVMSAARLPALARHIDREGFVPVARIENLAVTRALHLLERFAGIARRVNGLCISGALHRTQVHE